MCLTIIKSFILITLGVAQVPESWSCVLSREWWAKCFFFSTTKSWSYLLHPLKPLRLNFFLWRNRNEWKERVGQLRSQRDDNPKITKNINNKLSVNSARAHTHTHHLFLPLSFSFFFSLFLFQPPPLLPAVTVRYLRCHVTRTGWWTLTSVFQWKVMVKVLKAWCESERSSGSNQMLLGCAVWNPEKKCLCGWSFLTYTHDILVGRWQRVDSRRFAGVK